MKTFKCTASFIIAKIATFAARTGVATVVITPKGTFDPSPRYASDLIARIYDNSVSFLLALASGLAVIFIIWYGIQYITSAGDPAKMKAAQKTLLTPSPAYS